MKSVLFVDDEQQVLDGLRDLLRKHRKQWHMEFANGAQPALAALNTQPFDVVICDMRMPGMDGAALLAHIKQHHPAIARVVLSGQADRASVMRALPAAHQFLSKPCDAESLRSVIERACQLQQLLSDENIRNVVGQLDHLPSAPDIYWELTRAAGNPDAGLPELASIVERDPAMSLKVLQLVNSAYFGASQRITSVQKAIARLGVDLLKALALSVHAFGTLTAPPIPGFSVQRLQEHSLLTARISKLLVADPSTSAEAFSAALMHDIGRLVLAMGVPEIFADILAQEAELRLPAFEVERMHLGFSHAEVGAYLLGAWGLPFPMVETVAFHHAPGLVPPSSLEILAAVHISDALLDPRSYEPSPERLGKLDSQFIASAGLQGMVEHCRELIARTAEM